jgi:hypothetical protein
LSPSAFAVLRFSAVSNLSDMALCAAHVR